MLKPGYYVARQGEPDFGDALALVTAGDVQVVGDVYDEEGVRVLAIHVPEQSRSVRQNAGVAIGTVGVQLGDRFFTNVLRDYEHNFGEKWWREAIQNGVDAGATKIVCTTEDLGDGAWRVTCEDNGSGMTEDVLVRAMLTLGESTKEAGTSTFGGFGRAKELLLLPWIQYTIETRDLSYTSHAADPSQLYRVPMRRGTKLSVVMPSDRCATSAQAIGYIARCNLPNVRFTVNGQTIKAECGKRAKEIREFNYASPAGRPYRARVSVDPKDHDYPWDALVRLNGLYMFELYVSNKPRDLVVIDLEGAAVDMLTSNRDGFAARELRREIDSFLQEVGREKQQALQRKKGIVSEEFVGGERFSASVEEIQNAYDRKQMTARMEAAGLMSELGSLDDMAAAKRALTDMVTARGLPPMEIGSTWTGDVDADTLAEMLGGVKVKGSTHVEAMTRILAWKPDYLVHNEVEGFHVPKKFWPTSMTSDVRRLVKCWAELCRFVMLQLGCSKEFGVGVIFSGSKLAEWRRQRSPKLNRELEWLLINPLPNLTRGDDKKIIDPRDDEQLLNLYAMAIHEATHMVDEVGDHDVSFAAALTANIARTYGQEKRIRAIRRSVLKYDREVRAEIKEAKGRTEVLPKEESEPEVRFVLVYDENAPGSGASRVRIWETFTPEGSAVLVMLEERFGSARAIIVTKRSHDYDYAEYAVEDHQVVFFRPQVLARISREGIGVATDEFKALYHTTVSLSTVQSEFVEATAGRTSASDVSFMFDEAERLAIGKV